MPDLESVWEDREDKVYNDLFGSTKGIFTLSPDMFAKFNLDCDPRWLFMGVFESAPNDKRDTWLYVSSGLSNPWDDEPEDFPKNEWSGLGTELVMETPAQANWAILLLQHMIVFDLSLLYAGKALLDVGHRINNGSSIAGGQESQLTAAIFGPPTRFAPTFKLDSGQVRLIQLVGVTATELAYAKSNTTQALLDQLIARGVYPITDPGRASLQLS